MPATSAKIVRFHQTGDASVLKVEDLPVPEPKQGELRIRVRAIGLNRAEVMFRSGQYLVEPHLPSKVGYEASGIVEAVGPGVDTTWVGKKVSSVPAFLANQYGVYGEIAIVPANAVAEFPEALSFEQATSIWMQYITAYGALVFYGKVAKGDFVLITAASSSVGVAAIETVRAEGGISIATTRTAAKKEELLEIGANYVIVTDEEDLVTRVQEITGGKGVRLVFDPIAGKGLEALAAAAAENGIIFEYGALAPEPTPFPLLSVLSKHLTVKGYILFEITFDTEQLQAAKQYVLKRIGEGVFKPRIAKTFPLAEIVEAHRYMEANTHIGKIVVTV